MIIQENEVQFIRVIFLKTSHEHSFIAIIREIKCRCIFIIYRCIQAQLS